MKLNSNQILHLPKVLKYIDETMKHIANRKLLYGLLLTECNYTI